jgi:hypothetical protein
VIYLKLKFVAVFGQSIGTCHNTFKLPKKLAYLLGLFYFAIFLPALLIKTWIFSSASISSCAHFLMDLRDARSKWTSRMSHPKICSRNFRTAISDACIFLQAMITLEPVKYLGELSFSAGIYIFVSYLFVATLLQSHNQFLCWRQLWRRFFPRDSHRICEMSASKVPWNCWRLYFPNDNKRQSTTAQWINHVCTAYFYFQKYEIRLFPYL